MKTVRMPLGEYQDDLTEAECRGYVEAIKDVTKILTKRASDVVQDFFEAVEDGDNDKASFIHEVIELRRIMQDCPILDEVQTKYKEYSVKYKK